MMPHPSSFPLSDSERNRYARQIMLPEVGEEGQSRLRRASVLCVGAGGLGSPALYYIAAAGVGHIGIIDDDTISPSNLQRQILHDESSVGMPKAEHARRRLLDLDSSLHIESHLIRLTEENADSYVRGYDLVIDACDNYPTRFLLNRACIRAGIPMIYGAVEGFHGQLSVFHPEGGGPCYRCMIPDAPRDTARPSAPDESPVPLQEIGVIGVTPGVIGSLQAAEAIKLILNAGEPLLGQLFTINLLLGQSRTIQLRPDPHCPDCGKRLFL